MKKIKLVRDHLLDNPRPGQRFRRAEKSEYDVLFGEKLKEEAAEVAAVLLEPKTDEVRERLIEELADLRTVFDTIRHRLGIQPWEVDEAEQRKKIQKGAFYRVIVLEQDKDPSLEAELQPTPKLAEDDVEIPTRLCYRLD